MTQGHHGDVGAETADVVLPGSAYTEKVGTYANMEGRAQRTARAVSPPGEARDDWKILRAISELAGKPLPYAGVDGIRERLAAVAPQLADGTESIHAVSPDIAKVRAMPRVRHARSHALRASALPDVRARAHSCARVRARARTGQAMLAVRASDKFDFDTKTPFASCIDNFYMTDAISRASTTMASCTKAFAK